jgi:hypothetical protein
VLLPASGAEGFTFNLTFQGDAAAMARDKEDFDIVWYQRGKMKLVDAAAVAMTLMDTQGALYSADKHNIGIRVRKGPSAAAVWKAVTGVEGIPSSRRWRVEKIPNNCATKGQITALLTGMQWMGEVEFVNFSAKDGYNIAMVRAADPPPTLTVKLGSGPKAQVCTIIEQLVRVNKSDEEFAPIIVLAAELEPGAAAKRISTKTRPGPLSAPPHPL